MGIDGISNNKPIIKATQAKKAELAKEFKAMDSNAMSGTSADLKLTFDEFFAPKKNNLQLQKADATTIQTELEKAKAQFKQYDTNEDGELNIDEFTALRYFEENPDALKNKSAKEFTYRTAEEQDKADFMAANGAPTGTITEAKDLEKIFELEFKYAEMKGTLKPAGESQAKATEQVAAASKTQAPAQTAEEVQAPTATVQPAQVKTQHPEKTSTGQAMAAYEKSGCKPEIETYIDGTIRSKKITINGESLITVLQQEFYSNGNLKNELISNYNAPDDDASEEVHYLENGQLHSTRYVRSYYAGTSSLYDDDRYTSYKEYYDNGSVKKEVSENSWWNKDHELSGFKITKTYNRNGEIVDEKHE